IRERWSALSWAAVVVVGSTGSVLAGPGDCQEGWSNAFASAQIDLNVNVMEVFDDGRGPALYIGGALKHVGGLTVNRIARFDGERWENLGSGIDGARTIALATFDDGTGSALYVGGFFSGAGEVDAANVARWDGRHWSALGAGVGG